MVKSIEERKTRNKKKHKKEKKNKEKKEEGKDGKGEKREQEMKVITSEEFTNEKELKEGTYTLFEDRTRKEIIEDLEMYKENNSDEDNLKSCFFTLNEINLIIRDIDRTNKYIEDNALKLICKKEDIPIY